MPAAYGRAFAGRPVLAILPDPLPLVAEVWSPSTGDYDIDTTAPVYQRRGDLEIWRIHPFTTLRTLIQLGSSRKPLHPTGRSPVSVSRSVYRAWHRFAKLVLPGVEDRLWTNFFAS